MSRDVLTNNITLEDVLLQHQHGTSSWEKREFLLLNISLDWWLEARIIWATANIPGC